jgi:hypothetical protein
LEREGNLKIKERKNIPVIIIELVLSMMFVILPAGTVRDERTFFILLSFLITLIIIALVLRHRRLRAGN